MTSKKLTYVPEQVARIARGWLAELDRALERIEAGDTGTRAVTQVTRMCNELGTCLLRLRQINARKCSNDYPRYENQLKREHEQEESNPRSK